MLCHDGPDCVQQPLQLLVPGHQAASHAPSGLCSVCPAAGSSALRTTPLLLLRGLLLRLCAGATGPDSELLQSNTTMLCSGLVCRVKARHWWCTQSAAISTGPTRHACRDPICKPAPPADTGCRMPASPAAASAMRHQGPAPAAATAHCLHFGSCCHQLQGAPEVSAAAPAPAAPLAGTAAAVAPVHPGHCRAQKGV